MQEQRAKEQLLEQALSISPGQFEQLCRILIKQSEKTEELELTPRSGDDGIDVHAVIDRDLFQARLGVQAKRNKEDNVVSSDTIRTFKGSLSEGNYHVGTFITTSSFTDPAIESAETGHIRLIDGEEITKIMLESQIGIIQKEDNNFEIDWDFWEIFEIERNDLIRSDAVPQANTVEHLNIVLRAIGNGRDVKPTIHNFLEEKTNKSWDDRQADYYSQAGWALGFVHKDTTVMWEGHERQQWTLSRIGQEYVEYLTEGDHDAAEELFYERIREMKITKRVLNKLEKEATIEHSELQHIVYENILPEDYDNGLKKSTAHRRGDTIGRWIEKLPEVVRHGPERQLKGSTYEYLRKGVTDF